MNRRLPTSPPHRTEMLCRYGACLWSSGAQRLTQQSCNIAVGVNLGYTACKCRAMPAESHHRLVETSTMSSVAQSALNE